MSWKQLGNLFIEMQQKFLQQFVAFRNLAIHFSLNLQARNFQKKSV